MWSALPAVTVPNDIRNYVRPVTAIQSVSAEASDPSLQVQARDEEIELLHTQIEHLQQINFPEFCVSGHQHRWANGVRGRERERKLRKHDHP